MTKNTEVTSFQGVLISGVSFKRGSTSTVARADIGKQTGVLGVG